MCDVSQALQARTEFELACAQSVMYADGAEGIAASQVVDASASRALQGLMAHRGTD